MCKRKIKKYIELVIKYKEEQTLEKNMQKLELLPMLGL